MNDIVIGRFLRKVRRRLWLEALLHRLKLAAWASSVTLLLLALARLLLGAPRPGTAILCAFGVGFVALVPALLSRPAIAACAQRADQRLGGYSLLTTAQEAASANRPGPAAELVVAQAQARVGEWRKDLRTIWRGPDGAGLLVAVIPVFVAVVVLEMSATTEREVTVPGSPLHTAGDTDSDAAIFGTESVLPELRQAIRRDSVDTNRPTQADGATSTGPSPSASIAPQGDAREVREASIARTATPGFAGDTAGAGREAGEARRNPNDTGPSHDEPGLQYSAYEKTAASRTGAVVAGRDATNRSYAEQGADSTLELGAVSPVPAPPLPTAWSLLTASEVAYARQYLAQMELPHD